MGIAPITRQTRKLKSIMPEAPGKAVDAFGVPVVDPTENVLALVDAEARFQNSMREMESKYQDAMRGAESKRLNDLADLRVQYEARINDVLTVQVKTTSELISTQLDKVTTALGLQITSSVNALIERIGQLERFRWEVGGKTSVQDPAIASALTQLTQAMTVLEGASQQNRGREIGRGEVVAYVLAAASVAVTLVTAFVKLHQ